MLVFAADLEEVEEVCDSGVDVDGILLGCGDWVGEVGYFEFVGALGLELVSDTSWGRDETVG